MPSSLRSISSADRNDAPAAAMPEPVVSACVGHAGPLPWTAWAAARPAWGRAAEVRLSCRGPGRPVTPWQSVLLGDPAGVDHDVEVVAR